MNKLAPKAIESWAEYNEKQMSNHFKRDSGLQVQVHNNNVEKALRQLKKKLLRDGLFNEIRERRYFKSNTEKRLKAEAAAAARHRRRQAKDNW